MSEIHTLPRRILAVGAHPDDLEILCAGSLARYARAGCDVTMCNATNGDLGGTTLSRAKTAKLRDAEARRSAAVIGAQYVCLGFPDGGLDGSSLEAREGFVDLIRETRPDLVLTHHPHDYHADHLTTSKLVFEATFMASIGLLKTVLPANEKILPFATWIRWQASVFSPSST